MSFWQRWREQRAFRASAEAYARQAWREPEEADVRWLAALATGGDEDHARWELRYCRRALAVLAAERDALDDRTGAAVSHAIVELLHRDRTIAADRVRMAERQFNARLGRYREALRERAPGGPAERLAGALLAVASGGRVLDARDPRLVTLVDDYWMGAQRVLRERFGVAQLPEHVRPSQAVGERR